MASNDFTDFFWGEKNEGFSALYHNMKCGLVSTKDFSEFVRESAKSQEDLAKSQIKIFKQIPENANGSFSPILSALRGYMAQCSSIHMTGMVKLNDLLKELLKYAEEIHKKHKSVKDEESVTIEIVKIIQDTTTNLTKAKDLYKSKMSEVEKLKREGASVKDIEKLEGKVRKSKDDYKNLVIKYEVVREDFEKKMTLSSKHFQEIETCYLTRMKDYASNYINIIHENDLQIGELITELQNKLSLLTINKLLETFTSSKGTGFDKPGPIEFDDEEPSMNSLTGPPSDVSDRSTNNSDKLSLGSFKKQDSILLSSTGLGPSPTSSANLFSVSPFPPSPENSEGQLEESPSENEERPAFMSKMSGFLLKRNRKKDKKKKEGKSDEDESSIKENIGSDGEDIRQSGTPTPPPSKAPEVDDEGYSKPPSSIYSDPWKDSAKNFYSSCEDSDEESSTRKIKVEIKPVPNGNPPFSASVDELRSAIGSIDIAPITTQHKFRPASALNDRITASSSQQSTTDIGVSDSFLKDMRRSQSQCHINKPSQDLFELSSPPSESIKDKEVTIYKELKDILSISPPPPPIPPPSKNRPSSVIREMVTNSLIPLPRPPSRQGGYFSGSRRLSQSPNPFNDSKLSLASSIEAPALAEESEDESEDESLPSIPLAVAFEEVCHACFKGVDESQCQVRLIGNMMISFPSAFLKILSSSSRRVQFKIKNTSSLESLVPNKLLISRSYSTTPLDNEAVFEFNMRNLHNLLLKESENNPLASYFNIDILKYQINPKEGAKSCPLQIVAYWKCEEKLTDLKLNYKYNTGSIPSSFSPFPPLLNVSIAVPISGQVVKMISEPEGVWLPESNRALWKFPEISSNQNAESSSVKTLRARFELNNGPSLQGTLAAQFNCEGSTLSGLDIELIGIGYRLSLVKKRFVSGKYICDGEIKRGVSTTNA